MHRYPPESLGGTELHVAALAAAQAEEHAVSVFARGRFAAATGPVRVIGFEPQRRPGNSFLERTDFGEADDAFRAVVAGMRPDVVHVHHLSGLSAGILPIAEESGARVVMSLHDHALACPRGQRIRLDLDPCPVLDRARCIPCVRPSWIEAVRGVAPMTAMLRALRPGESRRLFAARDAHLHACLRSVTTFLAPSRSAAAAFAEFYPPAPARMRVVPLGIAVPARLPGVPAPKVGFVVGYFGAVVASKGVLVLAEAARRMRGEGVVVRIHGDGPPDVMQALRAEAPAVEIAGRYVPQDAGRLMEAVDVVAVPSLWPETFVLVVREAWAHRRPVLASETGALIEAAGPERNRVGLVPPGDVEAWIAAIRRVRTDSRWRATLAGPYDPESFDAMRDAIMACYMERS